MLGVPVPEQLGDQRADVFWLAETQPVNGQPQIRGGRGDICGQRLSETPFGLRAAPVGRGRLPAVPV